MNIILTDCLCCRFLRGNVVAPDENMVINKPSAHKSENYLVVDGTGKEGGSAAKEPRSAKTEVTMLD